MCWFTLVHIHLFAYTCSRTLVHVGEIKEFHLYFFAYSCSRALVRVPLFMYTCSRTCTLVHVHLFAYTCSPTLVHVPFFAYTCSRPLVHVPKLHSCSRHTSFRPTSMTRVFPMTLPKDSSSPFFHPTRSADRAASVRWTHKVPL